MRRLVSRVFDTYKVRPAALAAYRVGANAFKHTAQLSTGAAPPHELTLPNHIKFRMPDLNFKEVGNGMTEMTLTKWYVKEGAAVKDGTHMCEIDTPDLCFQLESGDEGFIARLLVDEGTSNISPGQPLAIIVFNEEEVERLTKIVKEHPHCIEGYVQPKVNEVVGVDLAAKPVVSSTENAASSDVLRMLNKLQKEGLFKNEKDLKVLKSLARKNNEQLITTFKASYENGVLDDAAFDKVSFVENALELAEEARGTTSEYNAN